ncbi:cytochrome P450 [Crassisporium funariophilum]|nr:cytochrome P450 [Crassisporium funariophilum]
MSTSTLLLYLLTIFGSLLLFRYWTKKANKYPLPPGPGGYPIIGNIHDVPHEYAWLTYSDWAKKYGHITYLNILGNPTIILNSAKAAIELLETRSSNYSDRPRMIMANELMGWEWDFAHMAYSDKWRRHRRAFHQYFQPRNLASYYSIQKQVTLTLLEQLSQSPNAFVAHVRQHVGSIVLKVAYGYEVKAENDFYIKLAKEAIQPLFLVVHAGTYLVEYLPLLKNIPTWFPGATFKRQAEIWSRTAKDLCDIPFDKVKQAMANGVAEQSFVSDNLERLNGEGLSNPEEEEIIKNCAGIAYLAGSDTTASLMLSWMLAMAHYPDVQKRAQAELDSVIGRSRLPDFSDRPSLPYIEALLLETLRWSTVTPLALPHRALQDDIYDGYLIPKGVTITVNAWYVLGILHDPELYPDPFQFKPERFVEEEGKPTCPDPTTVGAFGFGRRVCPGRYLATNSAWIAIVSILSAFNISKFVDETGKVVEPLIEYTDGLVTHPKPFKLQISPRSPDTTKLIEVAKFESS